MIPARLVIVGAGAVGCHYAAALAAEGATVTLIVRRGERIRFAEQKILSRLAEAVEVLYDRDVVEIATGEDESVCILSDGSAYPADRVLVFENQTQPSAERLLAD
jgi:pyruvate/2-oxoglutarate dehydrogenase complex dihydrolipoamide dehydrogenase (E3) component